MGRDYCYFKIKGNDGNLYILRFDGVNDCRLFVANYPHFHEMHAERGQIFPDIADILVLGAARQDLVADHQ
jgi:hypothetical protein